jgi:hypothetical protein
MAYNVSENAIEQVRHLLMQLDGNVARFETNVPQRLAYNLRQGCKADAKHGTNLVKAVYRFHVVANAVVAIPVESLTQYERRDPSNILELVSSVMENPIHSTTVFPNVVLEDSEFPDLNKWLVSQGLEAKHAGGRVVVVPLYRETSGEGTPGPDALLREYGRNGSCGVSGDSTDGGCAEEDTSTSCMEGGKEAS